MSKHATIASAAGSIDPSTGLIMRASDHLIPLFLSPAVDAPLARQMAIGAIDAYRPSTPADCVNVARTIAFSMAALALLGQAAGQTMTMTEKMRAFSRANALNRSADQSERTMMQRRRHQHAVPAAEPLGLMDSSAEPDLAEAEAEIEAAVAEALSAYRANRQSIETQAAPTPSPSPTPPAPVTVKNQHPSGQPPVAAPAAAIRNNDPRSAGIQHPAKSFREGLLRNSAIQRATAETRMPPPG